MGSVNQLTCRYNPHSIEKQARQWPVLFSYTDFGEDIRFRVSQLWQQQPGWASPFTCRLSPAAELQSEYGTDACRLAEISAGRNGSAEALLESSFKWLARLYNFFEQPSSRAFSAEIWLEAAIQSHDHVLIRNNAQVALALLHRATRLSPPFKDMPENERALVTAAVYPFAPILAMYEAKSADGSPTTIPEIGRTFSDLVCVRFALEKGGWHQGVFCRRQFDQDPVAQLRKLKWVARATENRQVSLIQSEGGLRICFL